MILPAVLKVSLGCVVKSRSDGHCSPQRWVYQPAGAPDMWCVAWGREVLHRTRSGGRSICKLQWGLSHMVGCAVHAENPGNWPAPGAGIGFDKLTMHMQAHCTYVSGQAEKQLIITKHEVHFRFKCVLLFSPNSKYLSEISCKKISQINSMRKF